jgi:hypothetical protein
VPGCGRFGRGTERAWRRRSGGRRKDLAPFGRRGQNVATVWWLPPLYGALQRFPAEHVASQRFAPEYVQAERIETQFPAVLFQRLQALNESTIGKSAFVEPAVAWRDLPTELGLSPKCPPVHSAFYGAQFPPLDRLASDFPRRELTSRARPVGQRQQRTAFSAKLRRDQFKPPRHAAFKSGAGQPGGRWKPPGAWQSAKSSRG